MNYYEKYLKYKNKYLQLKKMHGGNPYEVALSHLSNEVNYIFDNSEGNQKLNRHSLHIFFNNFIAQYFEKTIKRKIKDYYNAAVELINKESELYKKGSPDITLYKEHNVDLAEQFPDIQIEHDEYGIYSTEETRDMNNLIELYNNFISNIINYKNYDIGSQINYIITSGQYDKTKIKTIIEKRLGNLEEIIHRDREMFKTISPELISKTYYVFVTNDANVYNKQRGVDFILHEDLRKKILENETIFKQLNAAVDNDDISRIREICSKFEEYDKNQIYISKNALLHKYDEMTAKYLMQ